MATSAFARAAESYWKTVGKKGSPPELPDADVDAFIELLHLTGGEDTDTFHLVELPHDPYPGLIVNDDRTRWGEAWAIALCELEPFATRVEPGTTFLVDTVADAKGEHRVYSIAEGLRGMLEFASLSSAIAWMEKRLERAQGKIDAAALEDATAKHAHPLDDAWEEGPSSGMYVLETLLDAPLAETWDAYSRGEWPVYSSSAPSFRLRKTEGWERQLSLHLVRRFLEKRIVDFPRSLKAAELGAAPRALLEHLTAFEEAIKLSIVPEPVEQATEHADPIIAERASAWIERHASWQGVDEGEADDDLDEDLDATMRARPSSAPPPPKKPTPAELGVTKRKPRAASAESEAPPAPKKPEKATKATKKSGAENGAVAKKAGKAEKATKKAPGEAKLDTAPSGAKDDKLQRLARMALSLDGDEPEEIEDTPFVRKLRMALTATLERMIAKELIEIEDDKRTMLLTELVVAGADARSVKHMLDKLTNTLVSSDHVDEVYASDDEIQDFFKAQLGA